MSIFERRGGTTINFAFLTLSGRPDTTVFYERLAEKENHRILSNEEVFVGWNGALLDEGWFTYGFSHIPYHKLNIPKETYTFTCLRDPADRVKSHYAMLLHYKKRNLEHPMMETEGAWLGESFDDFLDRIPKEHLMNQLYMFSESYDVQEAAKSIRSLDRVLYTEHLAEGLKSLSEELDVKLPVSNQKTFNERPEFTEEQLERLHEMLAPEYQLLDLLRSEG